MRTTTQEKPESSDALQAAIRVHDESARDLMRSAARHLRAATALTRQLDQLDRGERRGRAS
jgi:hypothetical protein